MTAAADGRVLSRAVLLAYGLPGLPLAAVLPAWKALGSFFGVLRGGEKTL